MTTISEHLYAMTLTWNVLLAALLGWSSLAGCTDPALPTPSPSPPEERPQPFIPDDRPLVMHAELDGIWGLNPTMSERPPRGVFTFSVYDGRLLTADPIAESMEAFWGERPRLETDSTTAGRRISSADDCPLLPVHALAFPELSGELQIERTPMYCSYGGGERAEVALMDAQGEEQWRRPFPTHLSYLTARSDTLYAIDDVFTRRQQQRPAAALMGATDSVFVHRYLIDPSGLTALPIIPIPLPFPARLYYALIEPHND